jgi:hypothetical protein
VFGISAREALYERPTWEIDNLLAHYRRELQAQQEEVS